MYFSNTTRVLIAAVAAIFAAYASAQEAVSPTVLPDCVFGDEECACNPVKQSGTCIRQYALPRPARESVVGISRQNTVAQ